MTNQEASTIARNLPPGLIPKFEEIARSTADPILRSMRLEAVRKIRDAAIAAKLEELQATLGKSFNPSQIADGAAERRTALRADAGGLVSLRRLDVSRPNFEPQRSGPETMRDLSEPTPDSELANYNSDKFRSLAEFSQREHVFADAAKSIQKVGADLLNGSEASKPVYERRGGDPVAKALDIIHARARAIPEIFEPIPASDGGLRCRLCGEPFTTISPGRPVLERARAHAGIHERHAGGAVRHDYASSVKSREREVLDRGLF